jgi:hypothetical protein
MSHVQLVTDQGITRIFVDGVDLTGSVLADGFKIYDGGSGLTVSMKLHADVLEADLPDAVLEVLQ